MTLLNWDSHPKADLKPNF